MPRFSDHQRLSLDEYIKSLVSMSDGLTLDDFRPRHLQKAKETEKRIRIYLMVCAVFFLVLLFLALIGPVVPHLSLLSMPFRVGLWGLALGGLGAVASIFLHVLKLKTQITLEKNDEFEVVGRIFLGCIFSTIFALTIGASSIANFLNELPGLSETSIKGGAGEGSSRGVMLLLPFLAGYSITLVLGLLEKAVRAVEMTIGIEDRLDAGKRIARRTRR